ncbi:hypothetical protein NQ317_019070 [Molorchus minor]|uniref:Tyr recombinase domain-containing protein n=1 Tax=Molorchus minor TaxID=1323400 RepID=A0ABQ9J0H5_9CUCU|nr:hypothetical protein NQ317_019070 [Molorchus minor]
MSDSEFECTPPEVRVAAERATEGIIPEKSRERYENTYELYSKWCVAKGVQHTSETVLLAYFCEISKQSKASTLWSRYSMLRAVLNFRHNVDISNYAKLKAFLKRKNVGYQAKKSKYLPQKVALIIGISGACRCDELLKMKISDLDILENRIIIVIPVTKTYSSRTFVITKSEWINIIKQYCDLRNNIDSDRFFLQIRFGKITRQPFGHNAIGSFPKKIATYLKLENVNRFTGHCFRRTSATLLANTGGDILQLKKLGGWKSNTVAEGYVENSLHGQIKIANMLSHVENPETSASSSISETHNFEQHGLTLTVNSNHNSNVTINIYNSK